MATNIFLGRDGVWPNVDNWSLAAIPIDAHDVLIPSTTSTPLTTGLDRTGDTGGAGLHLNSLLIDEHYVGSIGASGNPLKCTVFNANEDEASIYHRGSGALYFNSERGTHISHQTGYVAIRSPNRKNAATIGGDIAISGLSCTAGHTDLTGGFSATLSTLFARQWSGTMYEPTVIVGPHPTAVIQNVWQRGGTIETSRQSNVAHLRGGEYTQAAGLLTSLYVAGAKCYLDGSDVVSSAILLDGLLDTTRTPYAKVISHCWHFPECTLKRNPQLSIGELYTQLFGEDAS